MIDDVICDVSASIFEEIKLLDPSSTLSGFILGMALVMNHPEYARAMWQHITKEHPHSKEMADKFGEMATLLVEENPISG